jgi:glycosyltransferase involved in cell wall biosynthesis
MAMGKPVISTNVGDIPEILGDTGYVVEPNNPTQIAATIQHIFQNWDEAVAKGVRSRQRCIEHYGVKSMGQGIQQAIDGLTVEPKGASIVQPVS